MHLTTVLLFRQCSTILPTCDTPSKRHLAALMQSLRGLAVAFMQVRSSPPQTAIKYAYVPSSHRHHSYELGDERYLWSCQGLRRLLRDFWRSVPDNGLNICVHSQGSVELARATDQHVR